MAVIGTLLSKTLKNHFKSRSRSNEEEFQLTIKTIEEIISERLPTIVKTKGAGKIYWCDDSEISSQWTDFGYSASKYDAAAGMITFSRTVEARQRFLERDKERVKKLRLGFSWAAFVSIAIGVIIYVSGPWLYILDFEELEEQINAGNVEWVETNASRVMPGGIKKFAEVRQLRRLHVSRHIETYASTKDRNVRESILLTLQHYPYFLRNGFPTLVPEYDLEVSLSNQVLVLQALADKIAGRNYDLTDELFLRDELCRAVEDEELTYTTFLISIADFDPGLLRCQRVPVDDHLPIFAAYIGSSQITSNSRGACPKSLRRISGDNWASRIASRNDEFIRRLGNIDFAKMDDTSEIQNAFYGAANSMSNLPKNSSMNKLLDQYDKYNPAGSCVTRHNLKDGIELPEGW
jgi:hypothetical protein